MLEQAENYPVSLLVGFLAVLGDKLQNMHLRRVRGGRAFLFSCHQTVEYLEIFQGLTLRYRETLCFSNSQA